MTTSKDLLLATCNAGKIREFITLLKNLPLRLRTLDEFPTVSKVIETGRTFSENAALKAQTCAMQTKLLTLADDSGLEVDALGGAPGILSARYAGVNSSDAEHIARLLKELDQANDPERQARFSCAIAIADPATGAVGIVTGKCEGRISRTARGANGFGYDPIFIPEGYCQTYGELPEQIKQRTSHRAQALEAACAFLRVHFPSSP